MAKTKKINRLKTKKAVLKRFKITKTGKIMRGRQMGRHLKLKKSKARSRRQQEPVRVTGKLAKKVKSYLRS